LTWTIPLADDSTVGLVSTAAQTFGGKKTFVDGIVTSAASGSNIAIEPGTTNTYDIGSSSKKFRNVYATTFYGALSGNATTATTATKVGQKLTIQKGLSPNASDDKQYDGSQPITITLEDLGGDNASRITTGVLPLSVIPKGALERIYTLSSWSAA